LLEGFYLSHLHCTGTVPLTGMPPMAPITVSDVTPVGTVMLTVADDVPFAICAMAGTTFGESADKFTTRL
jgi:hypothetical protein